MESKGRLVGFWICTAIICLSQGASGIMDFLRADAIVEGITALGYPEYVLSILGFWKLAAVPALLSPGFALVKEWAYAGLFFDFTGAFASHTLNGDGIDLVAPPLVLLAILAGSYFLRPASRRLS